ncbi:MULTISPECIES: carbon-nitrogen hydrolase family protein [Fusobacterium]|uniref:carbon-nitrogen hydrolase family protein n=1 Tax=Fusobacterium TaxID=848 RepID=UPI001477193A|nr:MULTISPECIES: carbon-nitrogen hydrolase family protein [Fusobacterium]NME36580.1 carbon-nitrogen hydrolase family protein [Fusobacterium sp. FSA-380-WT-3A]
MKNFKVAVIQMSSDFGLVKKNIEKAEKYIREAASKEAKLICLPEVFNTGIKFQGMNQHLDLIEKKDGYTLTKLKSLAKELKVHITCTLLLEVEKNICENTAILIDDEGNLIGTYAKTHPVGEERTLVRKGIEYPVFDTKLGKIGMTICYDACFPETSRILALNGAEIMITPAAWRGGHYFKEWWDLTLACRALDNLIYVIACNACGFTGNKEVYAGKSQVVNPLGQVLGTLGIEEETILYQDIHLDRVTIERNFNTVLIDRNIESYKKLTESIKGIENMEKLGGF